MREQRNRWTRSGKGEDEDDLSAEDDTADESGEETFEAGEAPGANVVDEGEKDEDCPELDEGTEGVDLDAVQNVSYCRRIRMLPSSRPRLQHHLYAHSNSNLLQIAILWQNNIRVGSISPNSMYRHLEEALLWRDLELVITRDEAGGNNRITIAFNIKRSKTATGNDTLVVLETTDMAWIDPVL